MTKPLPPGTIAYHADSTWTGDYSWNAGDPSGAGTGSLVPLAGYGQSFGNYAGMDPVANTLVMGNGHNALFLDDNISSGFNGGARIANIQTIDLGHGGQLVDLTSTHFSLAVTSIHGSTGNDIILNSNGDTTISGGSGKDYIWTGNGNSVANGGSGNDTLVAGNGHEILNGGSGNDDLIAGAKTSIFDGGSGFDTLDFSKVNAKLTIDLGGHHATLFDPTTGSAMAFDQVISIEKVIGTNAGMTIDTGLKAGVVGIGGAGDDLFHIESARDTFTGGGGDNTYEWVRKFVAGQPESGATSTITDFHVGKDTLNLEDFLKGQHLAHDSHPAYADVVHVSDSAKGEVVSVRAGGQFHSLVVLDGVHGASVDDLVHGVGAHNLAANDFALPFH